MPVSFHYQIPHFRLKNKKQITEWILLVAFLEKREIERIDFNFCSDEFLFELNKKFLSHKTYTDILTFDYSEGIKVIAEIYISIPRVKENAATFSNVSNFGKGSSFDIELRRVILHGVLHCFCYSDKSDREKKLIRRKEDEYLKL